MRQQGGEGMPRHFDLNLVIAVAALLVIVPARAADSPSSITLTDLTRQQLQDTKFNLAHEALPYHPLQDSGILSDDQRVAFDVCDQAIWYVVVSRGHEDYYEETKTLWAYVAGVKNGSGECFRAAGAATQTQAIGAAVNYCQKNGYKKCLLVRTTNGLEKWVDDEDTRRLNKLDQEGKAIIQQQANQDIKTAYEGQVPCDMYKYIVEHTTYMFTQFAFSTEENRILFGHTLTTIYASPDTGKRISTYKRNNAFNPADIDFSSSKYRRSSFPNFDGPFSLILFCKENRPCVFSPWAGAPGFVNNTTLVFCDSGARDRVYRALQNLAQSYRPR